MFKYIQKLMDKLKKSEKGQGMVEYALIIAVVAVIALVVVNSNLKEAITNAFNSASSEIKTTTTDINSERSNNNNNNDNTPNP